ncbi:MAG: tetratricopeptide repeat protein, partial [Planctomycetaceae bacterium]
MTPSSATTSADSRRAPQANSGVRRSNPWIVNPWADLLLIVATPMVLLAALILAQSIWSPTQITSFALIWAIGHHLPGMMRAYGDRALFERFKVRFVVAPAVLIAIGIYSSVAMSNAIPLAVGMWGWWHYLMQAYGFMRIYDAKAGSTSPVTCRLDQSMCLVWFAAPLALTGNGLFGYLNLYYKAGGAVIPIGAIAAFQQFVLIALVAVNAAFFVHAVRQSWQGRPPSAMKLILMASNFGYFWYCQATATNLLISYALYELFHDVQYLTIVWAFNQKRAERDAGAGGFTRFLFRRRWWLISAYLIVIAGYGLLNYTTRELTEGTLQRTLLGMFVASTVLHYYYDGFIWKLRESDTRKPLGLDESSPAAVRTWSHARSFALAGIPLLAVCALVIHERRTIEAERMSGRVSFTLDKHASLVAALPRSVFAHLNRGIALAAAGKLNDAESEYRLALELNPRYAEVPYNLANVLLQQGRTESAFETFQSALKLEPRHVEANYNVGVLLMQRGGFGEAIRHFEISLQASPHRAEILSNLGTALLMAGKPAQAVSHLRRALDLKPDQIETQLSLAQALSASGQNDEALDQYRRTVELHPGSASAHYNFGICLERGQRLPEAVVEYRAALKLSPDEGRIWNNLGVALAKQNQLTEAV